MEYSQARMIAKMYVILRDSVFRLRGFNPKHTLHPRRRAWMRRKK